jgi:hypothetical protein
MQPPTVYNSTEVLNSITNSNVNRSLWADVESPFTFNDFVKNSVSVYTPQQYNNAYKTYLENWYTVQGKRGSELAKSVKNEYINLLRNIALNYTTLEERRFLSNIDFNNNEDLAIAIPFFSLKLSDICNFYTEKREKLKSRTLEVKEKGSISQYSKRIYNVIYDLIFAEYGYNSRSTISENLSGIVQDLEIEVEELYDTYSEYFSIDAAADSLVYESASDIRNDYFTSNTNPVEFELFKDFDKALIEEIFDIPVIIDGLELFEVNYTPDTLDLICDNGDLASLFINDKKETASFSIRTRKALLEKYLGTDLFYLSTNDTLTDFVSGEFAQASNPAANYANNRHPSTASIPSTEVKSAREISLFFTPDKIGKLKFKTKIENFSIKDLDSLEPNKVYIYPDPELYGNVSSITDESLKNYPIKFLVDESDLRKSKSYGFAADDVYSTPFDTLGYSYASIEDTYSSNYSTVFNELFTEGLISDLKQDVYGNLFGIIKPSSNRVIEDVDIITAEKDKNYIVLDGYAFYDVTEGFGFNYSLSSSEVYLDYLLRTGLSAKTIDEIPFESGNYSTGYSFVSTNMFTISGDTSSLYFREYCPYIDAIIPNSINDLINTSVIYDGAVFDAGSDTLFADSSAYNDNYESADTYYNTLIEAGINGNNTLLSSPSGAASFLANPTLSADNTFIIDCSDFRVDVEYRKDDPYLNNIYDRESIAYNTTVTYPQTGQDIENTISQVRELSGSVYVYNAFLDKVSPLSSALSGVFGSFNDDIKDEIYQSKVEYFDVINDIIVTKTQNYFLIQGFDFNNGFFISKPNINGNTYYNIPSDSKFEKLSNIFYIPIHNKLYYCATTLYNELSTSKSKSIYPTIYSYDILKKQAKKIFPNTSDLLNITKYFSLSSLEPVNIVRSSKPSMIYNSRNNLFSITWAVEDGNYKSTIVNMKFNHKSQADDIEIKSIKAYKLGNDAFTYNFYETLSSSLLSATTINTTVSAISSTGELQFN